MNPRFQFSLRSLFWLTAVVAVVLGTMTALGSTHSFRALGSVHAYLALVPIAAVWVGWRLTILRGRRLRIASLVLYFTSLVLPSLAWNGDRPMYGLGAAYMSFVGGTMHPFHDPAPEPPGFLSRLIHFEFDALDWLACCFGFIANVAYLLILLMTILRRSSKSARKYLSYSAFLSALLLLIPLGLSTRLDNIYLGYGVWVAAMLAMWLRVREEVVICSSTSVRRTETVAAARPSVSEDPDGGDSAGH